MKKEEWWQTWQRFLRVLGGVLYAAGFIIVLAALFRLILQWEEDWESWVIFVASFAALALFRHLRRHPETPRRRRFVLALVVCTLIAAGTYYAEYDRIVTTRHEWCADLAARTGCVQEASGDYVCKDGGHKVIYHAAVCGRIGPQKKKK